MVGLCEVNPAESVLGLNLGPLDMLCMVDFLVRPNTTAPTTIKSKWVILVGMASLPAGGLLPINCPENSQILRDILQRRHSNLDLQFIRWYTKRPGMSLNPPTYQIILKIM